MKSKTFCDYCHKERDPKKWKKCPNCGSRQIPFLGYTQEYLVKEISIALLIIVVVAFIALIVGGFFLYNHQMKLVL
ncbi:hypothetical protein [Pelolinea submarina]|uniref:Uncharacterized protein n=1 Tax=Pelolinea submarina TaxID=913107 RepID=A0A3E0AIJ4_9CHLR|nr:hypothetical protein [Pelolinea submarina]REG11414.1 hypothetical protein DFR64_1295 [Pelolinea submarina]